MQKLGRHDDAAADLCAAIDLNPDYGDYADLTGPLKEAGRLDLVARVMEHWRDHPPRERWDYREKIEAYFRQPGPQDPKP